MFGRIKTWLTERGPGMRPLSMVANWLSNVLWLIETRFMSLAQQAYGQNEVVYACLRLLSHSVPEAPLTAYTNTDTDDGAALDPKHPLVRLIKRPNELMTEYEMWELVVLHLAICGRTTWWKERDNKGQIIALWPLRPDRVAPLYSDSDEPGKRVLEGWSYLVPGTYTYERLPRADVFFLNFADPAGESGGMVEGVGPIMALARAISSDNEATKFVGALLANYAAPTVALKIKAPIRDEAEANKIKAQFRTNFGGAQRGTPALLDADTEIEVIGFNLQDLEFPALRQLTEIRICATLGIPAQLIGVGQGQRSRGLGNGEEIREMRRFFAETTLANYWRRLRDGFQEQVVVEFGEGITVEFDTSKVKALSELWVDQMTPYVNGFKDGVVTKNEYRAKLNLPRLLGGDVTIIPSTAIEIPEQEEDAMPVKSGRLRILPALAATKAVNPRDEAEKRLQKALSDLFAKLSGDISARIRRGETISDQELRDAFSRVIEPQLVKAATDEGVRIAAEVGVEFDPASVNAAMATWASTYTFDLVSGLTDTTMAVLQNAISTFAETEGMTRGELEAMISPAFGPQRASMIAVTEVTRAAAAGINNYQSDLADSGITMERIWHTDNDDIVCDVCGPLNGEPESVWAGDYPNGPAAHVNCRCQLTLRSVAKAEAA